MEEPYAVELIIQNEVASIIGQTYQSVFLHPSDIKRIHPILFMLYFASFLFAFFMLSTLACSPSSIKNPNKDSIAIGKSIPYMDYTLMGEMELTAPFALPDIPEMNPPAAIVVVLGIIHVDISGTVANAKHPTK